MKEICLRHPFPSVQMSAVPSYGGDQNRLTPRWIRRCACGVVAFTDLLLYLSQTRADCRCALFRDAPASGPVSLADYDNWAGRLRRRYIPLIPRFGTNGLILVLGLNRYFRKNRISLRAGWDWRGGRLWSRLEETLSRDIPAILSIGPNFPLLWGRHEVTLYRRRPDGVFQSAGRVKAHFVTVTGMDERWLRISSWGMEYYILREEYYRYAREHSTFLFCNLAHIRPRE